MGPIKSLLTEDIKGESSGHSAWNCSKAFNELSAISVLRRGKEKEKTESSGSGPS